MIYGLVIGTIAGLITRMLIKRHMRMARARIFTMYLNPAYPTALCTPSRNMVSQEAYKDWFDESSAHWNERNEQNNRETANIPSWDGVAVEAKSLLIPAPSIFTIQEVKGETQHSLDDGD